MSDAVNSFLDDDEEHKDGRPRTNRSIQGVTGVGRTTLMAWMRKRGYLNSHNLPSFELVSSGYAFSEDTDYGPSWKKMKVTRWTDAGMRWLMRTVDAAVASGELKRNRILPQRWTKENQALPDGLLEDDRRPGNVETFGLDD